LARLEARRGTPGHAGVWLILRGESADAALRRAAAAGIASCGLLLPIGFEQTPEGIEAWERAEGERLSQPAATAATHDERNLEP